MEVSFRRDLSNNGMFRLELLIDEVPYYFMIDTGSSTNYLTLEAAQRLGDRIRLIGSGRTIGYGGRKSKKEYIIELSFSFNGEDYVQAFNVARANKSFELLEKDGFHLDGILGNPFLYVSKATIDYADLVIRFDKDREQKDLEEID